MDNPLTLRLQPLSPLPLNGPLLLLKLGIPRGGVLPSVDQDMPVPRSAVWLVKLDQAELAATAPLLGGVTDDEGTVDEFAVPGSFIIGD